MSYPIFIKDSWAREIFGIYIWHSFNVDGSGGHPLSLVPNPNVEDEVRRFAKLVVLPEFNKRFDALRRKRLKESFRYTLNYLSDEDEYEYESSLDRNLRSYLHFKETPEICYPRWSYWLIWDEMFLGESYEITDPSKYLLIYDRDISLYDDVFPEDGDYRPLEELPPYKVAPPPADWQPPRSSEEYVQTTPPRLEGLDNSQIVVRVREVAEAEGFTYVAFAVQAHLQAEEFKPYQLTIEAYKENGLDNLKAIDMFVAKLVDVFNWSIKRALDAFHDTLTEAQWSRYEGLSSYLNFIYEVFEFPTEGEPIVPDEQRLRELLDLFRDEDTRQFPNPLT